MGTDTQDLTGAARRGVRWTTLGAAGGIPLHILQLTVLARFLGPVEFGQVAIILVLLGIGTHFADLGFSSAIVQKKHVQKAQLGTLYTLNVIAGILLALSLWAASSAIEQIIEIDGMSELIQVAAVVFLIAPWGMQGRALLQKRLEFDVLAIAQLASMFLGTVVAIGLAVNNFGVWSLLAGYLVTEASRTFILLAASIRRGYWSGFAFDLAGTKSLIVFGGFRLLAMIANGISSRVDQLIVGSTLGAAPLGIYNVSQRLTVEPVQKLNPIVTRVAFPVFSIAQDQLSKLQSGFSRMVSLLLGIIGPILVGLAVTAHVLVPLILGSQWVESVVLVQLMAGYAYLRSIGNAAGSLIFATGHADWSFYWDLALLIIVPTAIWISANTVGTLVGVSVTMVCVYAVLIVCQYFLLLRRSIGPFGKKYAGSVLIPIGVSALMGLAVLALDTLLRDLPLGVRFAALAMCGAFTYATLSWLLQPTLLVEIINAVRRQPAKNTSFDAQGPEQRRAIP